MKLRLVTIELDAKRARVLLRTAGVVVALLTTFVVLAQSKGLTTWSDGQTLSADELNANFKYLDARITGLMSAPPPKSTAADATALPVRLLRVAEGTACKPGTAEKNTLVDCTCAAGEVAISGGGYCGKGNAMLESANQGSGRLAGIWRINCLTTPPTNYYALCLKVSR